MDISKIYIIMCEKAFEFQEEIKHHLKEDMFVRWFDKTEEKVGTAFLTKDNIDSIMNSLENRVVIFTQEQLKDYFSSSYPPFEVLEKNLFSWDWEKEYWKLFETFDQLFLAILMKDKYNKVWNYEKDEWLKNKN